MLAGADEDAEEEFEIDLNDQVRGSERLKRTLLAAGDAHWFRSEALSVTSLPVPFSLKRPQIIPKTLQPPGARVPQGPQQQERHRDEPHQDRQEPRGLAAEGGHDAGALAALSRARPLLLATLTSSQPYCWLGASDEPKIFNPNNHTPLHLPGRPRSRRWARSGASCRCSSSGRCWRRSRATSAAPGRTPCPRR